VQGPASREVVAALTSADLSGDAFPFRTAQEVDLGWALGTCARVTYVGELGYELVVPVEHAVALYEDLLVAGEGAGLRHVGLAALGSLRLEKGYRDFGHDIDNTDDPLEAGLGFAVAWDKPGGFVGREALLARREALAGRAPGRRLVQVLVEDPDPLLFHAEVLRRDGADVGYLRSASYGFTLGGAVGLAMVDGCGEPVDAQWLAAGSWTVQVGAAEYPARVSLTPMYDPTGARVRA